METLLQARPTQAAQPGTTLWGKQELHLVRPIGTRAPTNGQMDALIASVWPRELTTTLAVLLREAVLTVRPKYATFIPYGRNH
ncbi:MAG: hypothetical protein WC433_05855 [Candidatus Omnitrophota bacterium]